MVSQEELASGRVIQKEKKKVNVYIYIYIYGNDEQMISANNLFVVEWKIAQIFKFIFLPGYV